MKKIIIILSVAFTLLSCAPNIYQVYDKYDEDPSLQHTKIDGKLMQLTSFMIPKDQKATRSLIKSISSVDIVSYSGENNMNFQKDILKSLKRNGYREVMKNSNPEQGTTFFVKKGLTRVREFHVLNYEDGDVSVFSVNGKFAIGDLEKAYRLIKKQEGVKDFMDSFELKDRYIKEDN
ncbi:uncharacterized protein DUF4252 [Balneicella halophila]|uniref:Uncharacterized protein DUF4252 n=1 Tax=Balneicella halophila TaxID=1537566 RepID=A0A7L4URG6_BALHA|nr:DUF4252 domain-containing protein [Balneicella halophila]PVX52031.1 uncharacterized protein DUF4252 [Balneicella halophila]